MSRKPVVTVLMSVYNDRRYLPESIGSILVQSHADFELLIVDDGSTDGSSDYLRNLADPRVRVIQNHSNLGLTRSLNIGLNQSTGKFVARMDADDIAMPQRLRRQVQFLDKETGVGVVGTSRTLISDAGRALAEAPAVTHDLGIRWKCLLGNPLAHPTVMLRLDVLNRHKLRYDERYETAQDYELWSRLLPVTKAANLPEPLVRYRLRSGVSLTRKADQLANHDRIAHAAIGRLVPRFQISEAEVTQLRGRFGGHSVRDGSTDVNDRIWLRKYRDLLDAFAVAHAREPGISAFHAAAAGTMGRAA
jgi:glycosyltransferase involved in cell wall biosynthesis